MNEISWVIGASSDAWLGIGAYLFSLARRAAALERRLQALELSPLHPKEGQSTPPMDRP